MPRDGSLWRPGAGIATLRRRGAIIAAIRGFFMARGVLELLEEINAKGTTIIMVTHDPELAARAQRNVHIVDGMATDLSVEPSLARVAQSTGASADTSA